MNKSINVAQFGGRNFTPDLSVLPERCWSWRSQLFLIPGIGGEPGSPFQHKLPQTGGETCKIERPEMRFFQKKKKKGFGFDSLCLNFPTAAANSFGNTLDTTDGSAIKPLKLLVIN